MRGARRMFAVAAGLVLVTGLVQCGSGYREDLPAGPDAAASDTSTTADTSAASDTSTTVTEGGGETDATADVTDADAAPLDANDGATCGYKQNPVTKEDVDGDGNVTASDAVTIVNWVNASRRDAGDGGVYYQCVNVGKNYVDVNGDGDMDDDDKQAVIDYLNGSD